MKKTDVKIGAIYRVKVSGQLVPVVLIREHPIKGWIGTNLLTHRDVRIKTAARLRCELTKAVSDV